MITLFYDDPPLATRPGETAPSIFLAGPTARGRRTRWRLDAIALLARRGFGGVVVVPEFRDRPLDQAAPVHFGGRASPVPNMKPASYGVLEWETAGIERATIVLFWMPFRIAAQDDPESLPGFTTRAEVSRELVRGPRRIVLGMPDGALSSAHIRYHAHRAGVRIHGSLDETVAAAIELVSR